MQLYLIRHAHAVTAEAHPRRPLSARGQAELQRLGAFLQARACFRPRQYWHSPLDRAAETAAGLARTIDPEALLVETDDLLPEDDPQGMARRIAQYPTDHDLALVGHDPHLSALASLLVRGRERPELLVMRKGAVLALERTDRRHKSNDQPRWRVRWLLAPELLAEENRVNQAIVCESS